MLNISIEGPSAAITASVKMATRRFERNVAAFADELTRLVPDGANLLFVHTMAGGFPRARVYMPLMTRIFRGTGDRYLPSEAFWASDLGRLWAASFEEVTARSRISFQLAAESNSF